ncbi:MAG: cation transporter [Clostridiales bacterium]|nr:cation transporter [Clostridiales bacterium]
MTSVFMKLFLKNTDTGTPDGRARVGNLAGIVGIICNVILFLGKFIVGAVSGSMAIAADAFNNLSDAGSSIVSLLGFWLGSREADEEHPFGHARYEYLAGVAVCVMIMAIGLSLAREGVGKILHPGVLEFGWIPAAVMAGSILVKLWLSAFSKKLGNLIDSDTLRATAADSRNDCISTGAVLLSAFLCEMTGLMVIDGIMALGVACFILYSGYGLLKDALDPLLGRSPDPELVKRIEAKVLSYPGVLGMHDLLVHDYGPGNQFASLHIEFAAEADVLEAHDLIDNIERSFWTEEHLQVVIHYDPIVTADSAIGELRNYISEQVQSYDERLNIHDLRVVPGSTHVNVIFDLLLPAKYDRDQEALLSYIKERVKNKNKAYICVIKVEHSYI